MLTRILAAATAAFALGAGSATAATIIQFSSGPNCTAGCIDEHHAYTQTISSGLFSGPLTIGGISFDRAILGAFGNSMLHVTFWTNGGTTMVEDFGNFYAAVMAGDVLTLNGKPFTFDGLGDLTFKIELVHMNGEGNWNGEGGGGGGWGFGGSSFGGPPSWSNASFLQTDDINYGGGGGGGGGGSLRTLGAPDFSGGGSDGPSLLAAIVVPEPTAWALMLLGFGGIGALLRSRRTHVAHV